jgi:hypothetical protein
MLKRPRTSKRLTSGLAVAAGVGLLAFEVGQIRKGDVEAYFWLLVGGLMLVLGLVGLFERSDGGGTP